MTLHVLIRAGLTGLLVAPLLVAAPAFAQQADVTASFIDRQGADIGNVTISTNGDGLAIIGAVRGVPAGEHGFHIHETGTCDAAGGFESAGAHFEPADHQHGDRNPQGPHAGDLDNLVADGNGMVAINVITSGVSLTPDSLLDADGSALVIHADPDDYRTDPSGNSGDRIACALIKPAE